MLRPRCLPAFSLILFLLGSCCCSTLGSRFSPSRRLEGYVNVIISLNDGVSMENFLDRLPFFGAIPSVTFHRTNAVAVTMPSDLVALLEMDSDVERIDDDSPVKPFAETIPWGVSAIQGHDASIGAPADPDSCFNICVIDSGLQVSHSDIPYSVDGSNIMGQEFNLGPGQSWHRPIDTSSHGTHVTGTIIAEVNNDEGITGVIQDHTNYCLLIARIFPDHADVSDESIVDSALEWCADNGAKVINMSLGGTRYNENSMRLYDRIVNEEGILVVAASGNGAGNVYVYPASYETVLSVAAVDNNLDWAFFSVYNDQVDVCAPGVAVLSTVTTTLALDDEGDSYDAAIMHFSLMPEEDIFSGSLVNCGVDTDDCESDVEGKICLMRRGEISFTEKAQMCEEAGGIAAVVDNVEDGNFQGTLGEDHSITIPVLSLSKEDGKKLRKQSSLSVNLQQGDYQQLSGTSMASPHVAATAAKIWAARPNCTNTQIREAIETTAIDLGPSGKDVKFGHGLVQAADAYQALLEFPPPCGLTDEERDGPDNGGGAPDQGDEDDHPPKKEVDFGASKDSGKLHSGDGPVRGGIDRRRQKAVRGAAAQRI